MQASQTGSYNEQYSNSIQSEPIENIQLSHLVNRKALPGPSKNPSASTTNYAPIGAEQSVERWSTRPKELNQSTHAWDLAFLWDIFITILPVFFLGGQIDSHQQASMLTLTPSTWHLGACV